jgi:hypothetical protein
MDFSFFKPFTKSPFNIQDLANGNGGRLYLIHYFLILLFGKEKDIESRFDK